MKSFKKFVENKLGEDVTYVPGQQNQNVDYVVFQAGSDGSWSPVFNFGDESYKAQEFANKGRNRKVAPVPKHTQLQSSYPKDTVNFTGRTVDPHASIGHQLS